MSASATVRTIFPLRKMTPLLLPAARPTSASRDSPGPVDDTAHDGDADRLLDVEKELVDLIGELEEIDFDPAAGRAGDHRRALLAQLQALEDLVADEDLFDRVGGQGDADRVADAEGEERADADGGANTARPWRARFGDAEVEWVVVRQGSEATVGFEEDGHLERFETDLGQPEVEVF